MEMILQKKNPVKYRFINTHEEHRSEKNTETYVHVRILLVTLNTN